MQSNGRWGAIKQSIGGSRVVVLTESGGHLYKNKRSISHNQQDICERLTALFSI